MSELDADLKTCRFVIFDLKRVQSVDFTAVHMLKQIEDRLHERGGRLLLCRLPRSLPTGQDPRVISPRWAWSNPSASSPSLASLTPPSNGSKTSFCPRRAWGVSVSAAPLNLEDFELVREFGAEALSALRSILRDVSIPEGQAVFRRGETGDEVYLIRKGRVRILLPLDGGQEHHVATFDRRDFFGEIAFLDCGARTADAVALTPTELLALSRARFNDLSRAHPALGAMLFARLSHALALRLRQADEELGLLHDV